MKSYGDNVCNICGCEYTPKKKIPAPLCEACWEEHKEDSIQTNCEVCGDPYIKRDGNNKFSICDRCLSEHVFSNKDTVIYQSYKKKHKKKHKVHIF